MYHGLPKTHEVKARKPGSLHPFKRLKEHMAKVDKIRQEFVIGSLEYQIAIQALAPYTGRGHGGHHKTKNRTAEGRWNQSRSKYTPHQGLTERARTAGVPSDASRDQGRDSPSGGDDMITKNDAERLKAYITATWMGVVDQVSGADGCDTCGYGATEYNHIELEGLHKLVDDFLASKDNK